MDVQVFTEAQLRASIGLEAALLEPIADGFKKLSAGEVTQPPIMRLDIPDHHGEVDIKSAYVKGWDSFAVKLSSGFFDNYKRGLPSASGLMILLSAETGVPQALLLDNGYLTELRTALAGAVAADALAREGVQTVGILGSGSQARYQLRALTLVRPVEQVYVWSRDDAHADRYCREMQGELGIPVVRASSPSDVARASDLLVTTTPSSTPLLTRADLHPGLHLTALGSDAETKQELAPDVFLAAEVIVCDSRAQGARLGELRGALSAKTLARLEDAAELGEVLSGTRPGRTNDAQISICDLTGTGMQDTVIARLAVARLAELE